MENLESHEGNVLTLPALIYINKLMLNNSAIGEFRHHARHV